MCPRGRARRVWGEEGRPGKAQVQRGPWVGGPRPLMEAARGVSGVARNQQLSFHNRKRGRRGSRRRGSRKRGKGNSFLGGGRKTSSEDVLEAKRRKYVTENASSRQQAWVSVSPGMRRIQSCRLAPACPSAVPCSLAPPTFQGGLTY